MIFGETVTILLDKSKLTVDQLQSICEWLSVFFISIFKNAETQIVKQIILEQFRTENERMIMSSIFRKFPHGIFEN